MYDVPSSILICVACAFGCLSAFGRVDRPFSPVTSKTEKILKRTVLLILVVLIVSNWSDLVAGLASKIPALPENATTILARMILVGCLVRFSRGVVLLREVKVDRPLEVAA
ncbi:hypothetical protein MCEMSE15_02114 [Fimbriimonadaceae bacterium]